MRLPESHSAKQAEKHHSQDHPDCVPTASDDAPIPVQTQADDNCRG